MPKIKTHKGAKARLHISGTGKIMQGKVGGSHLRRHKSKRTKRQYGEMIAIDPCNVKRIRKLIPTGVG
jgi:large subunit ribosomal protein L35